MGDIVSLKLHRKRQARAADEREAAGNRVRHGVSKAEKQLADTRNAKAAKDLDAKKRED